MERRQREREFALDRCSPSQRVKITVHETGWLGVFYLPCGGIYWTQRIKYAVEHVHDLVPEFAALPHKVRRSTLVTKLNGEVVTDQQRADLQAQVPRGVHRQVALIELFLSALPPGLLKN
jgi:hypothetical protein